MRIETSRRFQNQLRSIVRFIALDSVEKARRFRRELTEQIRTLKQFPFRCRASIYFESELIRDLIFKGYVIPYFVDEENERIIILGIVKYKESL